MNFHRSSLYRLAVLVFALAVSLIIPANLSGQPGGMQFHVRGGGPGFGQQGPRQAFITGRVFLSPDDVEAEEAPGVGVIVTVYGKKVSSNKVDTLYTEVGDKGRFFLGGLAPGDVFIRFSMVGYEEQSNAMKLVAGPNEVIVNLQPQKETLDAAVKKETVSPVSVKGDTIVFHAAAVKTNKGENAIDVLEQMPGVEVTTSSVTVLGEEVQQVYIDGALLFGSAPMRALNNLPAEEVVSIKSFQEYANKDPNHKISKNESKQRVLDISTKSKMKGVFVVNAIAGAGYDTDTTFHKFRYRGGASAMYFSEALQTHLEVNTNNINDGSNRQRGNSFRMAGGGGAADLKATSINFNINRTWMSPTHKNYRLGNVGGSYSYSEQFQVNESMSEQIYFPTDKYTSRKTESSSYSSSSSKRHQFSVNGMKALKDGSLNANAGYSFNDGESVSRSRMYNYQDKLSPQGTSSSNNGISDGHSFNFVVSGNKGFWNKLRVGAGVNYSESNSDAGSTKIDTTTSTITYTVLDINTGATSRNFSVSPSVRYEITDRSSVSLSYSFNDSYSQSEQWAYNVTDPLVSSIDSVNTQLRTNATNDHTAALNFNTAFGKNDDILLGASLNFVSSGLSRTDEFPDNEPEYSRRFNSLRPSFNVGNNSQINHWSFNWSSSAGTPSIEQMRPKLNNSNLYSVSAGNPNLRQSKSNGFNLSYSTVLGKDARKTLREGQEEDPYGGFGGPMRQQQQERYISNNFATFQINAGFNINNDVIVGKKTYFAEETYLPEYSYTMPAQSTFSTYENAASSYSASLSSNVGVPLNFIRCILNGGVSIGWDKSPSYINSVLTQTENLRPTVNLGLRSNISRNVRFNIRGNASYVNSWNDANGRTEYYTEAVRAGFELNNILKLFYAGGNYTKTFMQGIAYTSIADNILDLNGGLRFGPRNNYDFSVKVHDLFNKTSGFSTSMNGDFVRNSWTHNFGRYVMFTFIYNFTSMKGGRGGFGGGMGMRGF